MSSSTADRDLGGFPQGWGVKCIVQGLHILQTGIHAAFWTHSCPTTGNSKPDSPYQPACVRTVTSGLRGVRLCTASASWCWINGWNVRQKLNLCLLRRHDHTKVTWSPWLPFMISFFVWPWRRSRILKTSQTIKMTASATVHAIQNTRTTFVVQSQQ